MLIHDYCLLSNYLLSFILRNKSQFFIVVINLLVFFGILYYNGIFAPVI